MKENFAQYYSQSEKKPYNTEYKKQLKAISEKQLQCVCVWGGRGKYFRHKIKHLGYFIRKYK